MAIRTVYLEETDKNPLFEYLQNNGLSVEEGRITGFVGLLPQDLEFAGPIKKIKLHAPQEEPLDSFKTTFKQRITLTLSEDVTDVESEVVDLTALGATYTYHDTVLNIPSFTEENENTEYNKLFSNFHAYYNFRIKFYESFSSTKDEKDLPMHLAGIYNEKHPSLFSNRILNYGEELADNLDESRGIGLASKNISRRLSNQVNNNYYMFSYHQSYDYKSNIFYHYAYSNEDFIHNPNFMERKKNIYVNFNYGQSSKTKILDLPYFNSIRLEFDNGDHTRISNILRRSKFSNYAMNAIRTQEKSLITMKRDNRVSIEFEDSYEIFDLYDVVKDINTFSPESKADELYLRDIGNDHFGSNLSVLFGVEKIIAMGKLRKLFKDERRNFKDMFLNKRNCYSELITYVVTKFRVGRSEPIQTFYFFNYGESVDFIDSQIRFNTRYRYEINGYYAIMGVEYRFDNLVVTSLNDPNEVEVDLITMPSLKVIKVPIVTRELRVVEPPPLSPTVDITNVLNEDHKIQINLSDRHGILTTIQDRQDLVTLSEENELYKNLLSQYIGSDKTYFSFIASNCEFEIYRIENEPKSISDFENSLIERIGVDSFNQFGEPSVNATSIFDFLEHQKKYYYLFRTLTHNGNPSNPSAIYMVEKFKDADETILNVETFHLEEEQDYQMDMSFRKLLKIGLKPEHTAFNDDTYANGPEIVENANLKLGSNKEDILWNYNSLTKDYIKLRLESKRTGKKVDLNLIFNYNQPTNE